MEFITIAKAVLKPASDFAHLNPPTTAAKLLMLENHQGHQYALVLTPVFYELFQGIFQSDWEQS